jgi:hypothetical protein
MKEIIIRQSADGTYSAYERSEADPYDDPIVTGASLYYALDCARRTFNGEELHYSGGAF